MSWSFIKFSIISSLTMFAGAQTVHLIYQPLSDVDKLVAEELKQLKANK